MSVLLACVPAKVRTLDPLELEFWMVGAATWALGTDFLQQVFFHAEPQLQALSLTSSSSCPSFSSLGLQVCAIMPG